jgi:hypothetical protein
MRLEKCALIASDTLYARLSGELDRDERLWIYERITEAAVRWEASEVIIDKRTITCIDCIDSFCISQWDHDKIAELLDGAGVKRLLVAADPNDALSGCLINACRRKGMRAESLVFFDILDAVA